MNAGLKRASLNLDDDENDPEEFDLSVFHKKSAPKQEIDPKLIAQAAKEVGFVSRQATVTRRRKRKSPYTDQIGVKVRSEVREIFYEMSERLKTYDHTTFENAILALLEKEKMKDLLKEFKDAIK